MKQIVIVNESLRMPPGELAAQVAHAALQGFVEAPRRARQAWLDAGMPKVVLHAACEAQLRELARRAALAGLPAALSEDAALAAVPASTVTCLCIGPARCEQIDPLTREMQLLR